MQIMHSFYALGALSCPVLVSALLGWGNAAPLLGVAAMGLLMWAVYALAPLPGPVEAAEKKSRDTAFLRDPAFWLLTLLIRNTARSLITANLVTGKFRSIRLSWMRTVSLSWTRKENQ